LLGAVIFDMDGVIVDSEHLHLQAERKLFASFGIKVTDKELQSYMGGAPQMFLRHYIDHYRLNMSVGQLYSIHKKNLFQLYQEKVELLPGLLELIIALKNDFIDLAVASSSDRELIFLVLEKFDLFPYFKVIISGGEVSRPKPSPDIFIEALRRLDCNVSESVVIEDSSAGVKAAKSAGITCVGFRSPHSGNQDLSMADLIIDDLASINKNRLEALIHSIK